MTDETTPADKPIRVVSSYTVLGLVAALVTALTFAAGFFLHPSAAPVATPTKVARVVPNDVAQDAPVRTCSISSQTANGALGTASVYVRNADTDETLYNFGTDATVPMGSVMKVLTSAVALNVLGPDARLTTRVVAGTTPKSVILIGGGDPTLSAGNGTIYSGAPTMQDLARQTVAAYKAKNPGAEPISQVIVDLSMFPADDAWHSSWPNSERTNGYQPYIVPLMVDGDRANPTKATSPRSTNPADKAVAVFIDALAAADNGGGDGDIAVSYGSAPGNAEQLAAVSSQPVSVLVKQMLPNSDNTLAEFLLRASSVKLGLGGGANSLQQTIVSTLSKLGSDFSDGVFIDGSGESPNIRINPGTLAQLLDTIFSDAGDLKIIADSLPVAGKSGTLSSRFAAPNDAARGHVTAKTGWINGVYSLAGRIQAADGTNLIAVVVARGSVSDPAKVAIDTVFAGAYSCGNNLASY